MTARSAVTALTTESPVEVSSAMAPRRRTQTERREEAERRLLDAALAIVARTGTVRLTLAAVGLAAGYSRGLATHRFGNKAGLLRALAAHINVRFQDQMRAAPKRRSGLDTIRGHIEVYFGRTDRQWTTTRALLVMMTEGLMDQTDLQADMAAYNRQVLTMFEIQIRAGIEQGEVGANIDPAAASVMLLGTLRGVMMQSLLDPDIDLVQVRNSVLAMAERSLSGITAL